MTNFLTGSFIEVLYTDNTVARFPDQIGCLGIVEHAPIHPSTWFTIKMMDGRSIKLQTTAMKHVAKNDSRHQMVQSVLSLPVHKHVNAVYDAPIDIPKENHRPRSNSNVGIAHFTKGVSVIILRTDNVLHRVPHLVGVVGIIKEVPVHPITWFKIEFPCGQVATFRPSAFKLNDGKDEEVHRPVKKPTAFSTTFNQMYAKKSTASKEKDRSNDEYAVGMHVMIRSGELSGETGEVLKSSNGWIQVVTPHGKVAKRAHELDYADNNSENNHYNHQNENDDRSNASGSDITLMPSHNSHIGSVKAIKKAMFMSLHKNVNGPALPNDLFSLSQKCFNVSPTNLFKRKTMDVSPIVGSGIAPLYDLERQSADCPFPLIPLHIRQEKRKRLQSYVDSECEVISNRPDLSYWLQEIRSAISDNETNEDPYTSMPRGGCALATSYISPSTTTTKSSPLTSAIDGVEGMKTKANVISNKSHGDSPHKEKDRDSLDKTEISNRKNIEKRMKADIDSMLSNVPADLMEVTEEATVQDQDIDLSISSPSSEETVGEVMLVEGEQEGIENQGEGSPISASNSVTGSDSDNRDRSSSISETDCEESFSPEQPSHSNVVDFAERSVPSPFSLPPAGDQFSTEGLSAFNLQTIDIIQHSGSNSIDNDQVYSLNINDNRPKSRTTTFKYSNKSDFSTIPNPVKVFLPRQYTSHSCPTFSPFQTSSFSSFASTSTSQELKSPILSDQNEWKNFFSQEKSVNTFLGNKAPFTPPSGFLPFTSPIPIGNNEVRND